MKQPVSGPIVKLEIFIGEDDLWGTEPLYEAIVRKFRNLGIAGATAHRGLMGFGQQHRIHKSGRLGRSTELPVIVTVLDSPERIQRVLPVLREMLAEGGIAVTSEVTVVA